MTQPFPKLGGISNREHHNAKSRLFHFRSASAIFFRSLRRGSGRRRGPSFTAFEEILPEDQNRTGDENRGISSNHDSNYQRKCEAVQNLSTKQEQRDRC